MRWRILEYFVVWEVEPKRGAQQEVGSHPNALAIKVVGAYLCCHVCCSAPRLGWPDGCECCSSIGPSLDRNGESEAATVHIAVAGCPEAGLGSAAV